MTRMNEQARGGDPILPDSPLGRALGGGIAPPLSQGFADRVVAAAQARPAPLPELRRRPGRWSGWRMGQRLAIGAAGFVALASAAAATGVLQQFALPVPSAEKVWASITGTAKAAPVRAAAPKAEATPAALAKVEIDGPVDTPEELHEAFRRIDQVREGRRAERAQVIDQRITNEIERRRAAGLKVPTPEQEARLRQRIAAEEARRAQLADQRVAAKREALERKVENGEAITRDDIAPARERLRRMSPQQRRAVLQAMTPEQRRAVIEEYRARRVGAVPAPAPSPSSSETPSTPE